MVIEVVAILGLIFLGLYEFAIVTATSLVVLSFMLVAGSIDNRAHIKRTEKNLKG